MVRLSASRIETLKKCSWIYYCKYVLRLPDESNDGASRGTITHLVLECLLNDRHRHHFDLMMESEDVFAAPSIERLVMKWAARLEVDDEENIKLIKSFIWVGINHDFFCEGKVGPIHPEYAFDLTNKDPSYRIMGFIDKVAFYENVIKIKDYKTSKQKYKGHELTFNTQALVYSIAALKQWPEFEEVEVEFLFLKFPRKPSIIIKFTKDQLEGAELYLNFLSDYLADFTKKKAISNFAYPKGFPTDNTFGGKLICGGEKGELKKDGTPKWHCKFKYPFEFYVVVNKDGKELDKDFNFIELQLRNLNMGNECSIITKQYNGCPYFKGKLF